MNEEEDTRRTLLLIFEQMSDFYFLRVRNISDRYLIVRNVVTGREWRIDVSPWIDTTEVKED